MKNVIGLILLCFSLSLRAQYNVNLPANHWVDSVYNTLTDSQKLAQLMIVRLSSINASTGKITFYDSQVVADINRFNIGGICLFQGGPRQQAAFINHFQSISITPILFSIDAENGLGMRMDSVSALPRQMMLGAVQDPQLIYSFGQTVAQQCKRMGIQVNYAPVVDVNNNPDNPVINDRSFGEDPQRVATLGIQYMKGLQDNGVLATAKHFPGHGDVAVDSHLDLPVINKSREQLDKLELYPFKKLFEAGIGSVMIGHLFIPSIDNREHRASSISVNTVTDLLRKQMHFTGLSFTDALEMKGVSKYFPDGDASVESLIAGNDMLCLPGDVALSIGKIFNAIKEKKLRWKDLNLRVKRVLTAKYQLGLANWQPIDTANLLEDLNKDVPDLYRNVAKQSITLVRRNDRPFPGTGAKRVAYIGFGLINDNTFSNRMRDDFHANTYYFDYGLDSVKAAAAFELLRNRYDMIVIGLHNINRYPANNFGISVSALQLLKNLDQLPGAVSFVFGNPYALKYVCDASVLLACYDDNEITQSVAADWLNGKFQAKGRLPVTVCDGLKAGFGITFSRGVLQESPAATLGFSEARLLRIDSICKRAIALQATPGCVVVIAKNGQIAYEKAFGTLEYNKVEPVYPETIYDLASVTKVCATTISVMKLVDEGKLDLHKTLGDYLPWVKGTDKDSLKIWDIMLHQAGLKDYIPFYAETILKVKDDVLPDPTIYSAVADSLHCIKVAENMYMSYNWEDTMYKRIVTSRLGPPGKYVYSDNDFIFMGKIVETLSGQTLDHYAYDNFYLPMGLTTTGFNPRYRFPPNRIAPTEMDVSYRRQLLRGDVHDAGAAMFGGVSGHAGLFSDGYDLAVIMQMLLNGGTLSGHRYLKQETVEYFTAYHSENSRRGLGFDKPEKDNASRKEAYPCADASPLTFGHTGFTGTCVWADPAKQIVFVFLSNRVNPQESSKLGSLNVRGNIMESIYQAMQ